MMQRVTSEINGVISMNNETEAPVRRRPPNIREVSNLIMETGKDLDRVEQSLEVLRKQMQYGFIACAILILILAVV